MERGTAIRYSGISKIGDFRRLVETAEPFRDDNGHNDDEHHRHEGDEQENIDFPGMEELYQRFLEEVRKYERERN